MSKRGRVYASYPALVVPDYTTSQVYLLKGEEEVSNADAFLYNTLNARVQRLKVEVRGDGLVLTIPPTRDPIERHLLFLSVLRPDGSHIRHVFRFSTL